jgi:hypothetical protein
VVASIQNHEKRELNVGLFTLQPSNRSMENVPNAQIKRMTRGVSHLPQHGEDNPLPLCRECGPGLFNSDGTYMTRDRLVRKWYKLWNYFVIITYSITDCAILAYVSLVCHRFDAALSLAITLAVAAVISRALPMLPLRNYSRPRMLQVHLFVSPTSL